MARLLGHVAGEAIPVVLGRRGVEQLSRLLDGAHLGVGLGDDQLQQLVADLLRRHVGEALPAALAGIAAEGDFRLDRVGELGAELDARIRDDADLPVPGARLIDPIVEDAHVRLRF